MCHPEVAGDYRAALAARDIVEVQLPGKGRWRPICARATGDPSRSGARRLEHFRRRREARPGGGTS